MKTERQALSRRTAHGDRAGIPCTRAPQPRPSLPPGMRFAAHDHRGFARRPPMMQLPEVGLCAAQLRDTLNPGGIGAITPAAATARRQDDIGGDLAGTRTQLATAPQQAAAMIDATYKAARSALHVVTHAATRRSRCTAPA